MEGINKYCECDGPGFCKRHNVKKGNREFQLCNGQNCSRERCVRYWNSWEKGLQKGQTEPVEDPIIISVNDLDKPVKQEKGFAKKPGVSKVGIREANDAGTAVDQAISELEQEGVNLGNFHQKSEGLGDTLEKVFRKFGITEEVISKAMGTKGCGCSKRKKFLNKVFPYRNKKKGE